MKFFLHSLAALSMAAAFITGTALAAAPPQLPDLGQLVAAQPIAAPEVAPQPVRAVPCTFFVIEDLAGCRLALAASNTCPPEIPRRLQTLPLELFASSAFFAACHPREPPG
jgi:hypothetical protein